MTRINKEKNSKAVTRHKKTLKRNSPAFDDLILEGSLPRVKVKVYPSRKKSNTKSNDQLVIELQCEV